MNYKDVLYSLQDSFENHPYIARVLYSLKAAEAGNLEYPALIIQSSNIYINPSNKGMNTISINLMAIDLYVDTETIIEKLSSLITAIKLSLNRFADLTEPAVMFRSLNIAPFYEAMSDGTCGVTATLSIDYTDDIAECYIKDCEEGC